MPTRIAQTIGVEEDFLVDPASRTPTPGLQPGTAIRRAVREMSVPPQALRPQTAGIDVRGEVVPVRRKAFPRVVVRANPSVHVARRHQVRATDGELPRGSFDRSEPGGHHRFFMPEPTTR